MKARGLATGVSAVVLAGALSGCMTVHGETAVVSATTEAEAEKVLEKYVATANKAVKNYDARLTATVERGALAERSQAQLKIGKALDKDGNADHTPVKVTDANFHIPQQAGWPKFFLVDAASSAGQGPTSDYRLVLAFTRDSIDEAWKASYQAFMDPSDLPELAQDDDGHVKPVPASGGKDLSVAPTGLGKAYAAYLKDGKGDFADGPHTSGRVAMRKDKAVGRTYRNEWADVPADDKRYTPFGLYTASGDAMVFFATHEHAKQTTAKGWRPRVSEAMKPVLKGEVKNALTQVYVVQHLALVPAGEGEISFLHQNRYRISAEGG